MLALWIAAPAALPIPALDLIAGGPLVKLAARQTGLIQLAKDNARPPLIIPG